MATLISVATGNFTSSSSWALVDSTSANETGASANFTTTSYVASPTFTPGAITVDGIAMKIYARAASPTGTLDVQLWNSTDSTQAAVCTVNVSDIPAVLSTRGEGGWFFFHFGSTLLVAGKAYSVRVKSSSATQVAFYHDNSPVNDWLRLLRTTTTQAPASTDNLYILGDYTGAGTGTNRTITLDNTATTTWGLVEVGGRATFDCQNSASTNYYLKINTNFRITAGGTLDWGTTSTRIDSTSKITVEFVTTGLSTKLLDFGQLSTIRINGATKTVRAKLAADASAGATSLTTDVSTGWLNGDEIALAPTNAVAHSEVKALTAGASGTTLTISALTNAHKGTGAIIADLANLTRNVRIIGAASNSTFWTRIYSDSVEVSYVEFKHLGSTTTLTYGLNFAVRSGGTATFEGCSFHQTTGGILRTGTLTTDCTGITLTNNVAYDVLDFASLGTSTSTNPIVVDTMLCIKASGFNGFTSGYHENDISNIDICGCGTYGFVVSETSSVTPNIRTKVIDTVNSYMNGSGGFSISGAGDRKTIIFKDFYSNAGGQYGVISSSLNGAIFDNLRVRGCGFGFAVNQSGQFSDNTFIGGSFDANGSGLYGVTGSAWINTKFFGTTFGTSSINTTGDISFASYTVAMRDVNFYNCTFSSTNTVVSQNRMSYENGFGFVRLGGTDGVHRRYKRGGTLIRDTAIYDSGTQSQRMTPNSATEKLQSSPIRIPVSDGDTLTINIKVRKSVVGDGTAYNGNQPRLMLRADTASISGMDEDVVCATATNAANGAWETLTYTTSAVLDNTALEFYIDCDGTTGWVNWDSPSFS